MTFVCYAKFKSATWDKCIILFEIDVEFNTRINDKILMIRLS